MNLKKLQKAHTTFGRLMAGRRYEDVALRGAGELLKQIEPATGKNNQYAQVKGEGDHPLHSRQAAAEQAGMSEHQRRGP